MKGFPVGWENQIHISTETCFIDRLQRTFIIEVARGVNLHKKTSNYQLIRCGSLYFPDRAATMFLDLRAFLEPCPVCHEQVESPGDSSTMVSVQERLQKELSILQNDPPPGMT